MIRRYALLLCLALSACHDAPPSAAAPAAAEPAASLTVEGSALVLTMPGGKQLRGTELVGATIHLAFEGKTVPMKLAAITPDPDDPEILRHDFQVPDGQGGWNPACQPNAYGERWGFPVALPEGHPGREGDITMTCASGAVGKCARFGYKPWAKGPKGEDLVPLHAACVRMVRADYCGDGAAHTKNGTEIDMYDELGIQKMASQNNPAFAFEAGWTPQGAACVSHTRWSDVVTLNQLKDQCPRLANLPACDETYARAAGAQLFNRSKLQ
ncbi:MAG: hypothetical protein JWQ90_5401 [Hydrocarboniphaga sp.]|uniref:ADYC domain-containing protein n=1 Tax=Hydrocarboniphaga sp. TaxID=2033016 RepID=UPI0026131CBB|nr:ADYC domain-containing protein [Hydrocarboniphaga sp.]MDB5972951.1 hypothetical protein [Hydrocarboniphaga sp.]